MGLAGTCMAHMALMALPFPAHARRGWPGQARGRTVAREPFGRLEEVGEGLYALVSTPLSGDYTTVCNGGIVAGRRGVLLIEAFQTPEGARWVAENARELTGRWPTHVVITHCHGDHAQGLPGLMAAETRGDSPGQQRTREEALDLEESPRDRPVLLATHETRELVLRRAGEEERESLGRLWAEVDLVEPHGARELDLGGRVVRLSPRRGHTPSDLTIDLPDEEVVWCGDLVWNGMFPNYMDALPSALSTSVRSLRGSSRELYVPGHGPLAGPADMERYLAVIDRVEEAARNARERGLTAQEAGEAFRIPPEMGEWTLFNPSYFRRAMEAWLREWSGAPVNANNGAGVPEE